MKKYLLGLIFLAIPFATQASDYTEVAVRIETGLDTVFNDVVYVSSDGCMVTDSDDIDHDITDDKAICALEVAAETGDFTYELTDSDFGLFLNTINDTTSAGNDYWAFAVNYQSASVGLADYDLEQGDQILLSFGEYPNTPLKLSTRKQQIIVGQTINTTVKIFDDLSGEFTPVNGATVHFGKHTRITNAHGQAHFKTTESKNPLSVWAGADASTQSNTVYVRVYDRNQAIDVVDNAERATAVTAGAGYANSMLSDDTVSIGEKEWLAQGVVAAGVDITVAAAAVTAYEPTVADGASTLARHILALTALGLDASDTNGIDYVARLKSTQNNEQFGSAAYVNDDIYAGLALLVVGDQANNSDVAHAIAAARLAINDDGGVSYAVGSDTSDVDTTAAFVQLLAAVNNHSHLRKAAVQYLEKQQNLDGGWGYADHSASNSSSTAITVQALEAVGKPINLITRNRLSGFNYLLNTQRASGAFQYDLVGLDSSESLNTAYAILALTQQPLPVIL